jgi:molybdenum cofactor cytidylyltransferase
MGSSLVAGLKAVRAAEIDGIWLTFCDMPHLKPKTLLDLYRHVLENPDKIVLPEFEGRRGHPAYLPSDLIEELMQVHGDMGARTVVRAHEDRLLLCPVDDRAVLEDLDREEIYELVKRREGWK